MDSRPALDQSLASDAAEFVRFCYSRRRVCWPALYDEMCSVATRGLFRGWGHAELAEHGIGFSLYEIQALAGLAQRVIAEELERTNRTRSGVRRTQTRSDVKDEPASLPALGVAPVGA
jgi:hypothetical protein